MEQQNFTDTQTKINIKSKQVPKQSLKIEKKITAGKHLEHQLNFGKKTKCDDCDIYVEKNFEKHNKSVSHIDNHNKKKTDNFRFRYICKFSIRNLNEEHEITHHIENNSPKIFLGERKKSYSFHIYNNIDDEKNMIIPSYSLIKKLLPN